MTTFDYVILVIGILALVALYGKLRYNQGVTDGDRSMEDFLDGITNAIEGATRKFPDE